MFYILFFMTSKSVPSRGPSVKSFSKSAILPHRENFSPKSKLAKLKNNFASIMEVPCLFVIHKLSETAIATALSSALSSNHF